MEINKKLFIVIILLIFLSISYFYSKRNSAQVDFNFVEYKIVNHTSQDYKRNKSTIVSNDELVELINHYLNSLSNNKKNVSVNMNSGFIAIYENINEGKELVRIIFSMDDGALISLDGKYQIEDS